MIPLAFMPSRIETEGSIPNSHLKGEWEPALLASTLNPWVPTLWVREGLFLYHLPFLKPLLLTQHSADKRTLNCYLLASSRQKGPLHLSRWRCQKRCFTVVSSNLFCSVNVCVCLSNFMKIGLMSISWHWLSWLVRDRVKWKKGSPVWWLSSKATGNYVSAWKPTSQFVQQLYPNDTKDSINPTDLWKEEHFFLGTRREFAFDDRIKTIIHSLFYSSSLFWTPTMSHALLWALEKQWFIKQVKLIF